MAVPRFRRNNPTMAVHVLILLTAVLIPYHIVAALHVTPNSPCSSACVDSTALDESDLNSSNTVSSDLVCEDANANDTSTGMKWQKCMSCLQSSTFSQNEESDQEWFLYNLRYNFDYCVFGFPNRTGSGSNPCEIPEACGHLKTALEYGNLSTTAGDAEFGYCDADGGSMTGEYYDSCLDCVSASGHTNYIANALVALEAGCLQRPNTSDVLGLSGSVFSASVIEIVDPSTLKKSTDSVHLSTAVVAGIAICVVVFIVIATSLIFVRYRRRKNRSRIGVDPRWDKTHKRQSSLSFRCRKILASPMSPKFFRDELTPVEEHHPYGSLDEMTQSQISGVTTAVPTAKERYYIVSKSKPQQYPYETSFARWDPQSAPSSFQTITVPTEGPEQPGQLVNLELPVRKDLSEKGPMSINTTELTAPRAAHQSPRSSQFTTQPTPHVSAEQGPATSPPSRAFGGKLKKTTTMSSQGNGYPNLKSPTSASSLLKRQHGWPNAHENPDAWFPPPPPPGPHPKSSSSSLSFKYGRKGSSSSMNKARRDSGSPVESKKIQVSFPAPPLR